MALSPLITILVALILAYLFSEFFRRFGLPKVVGQIVAGLILGVSLIKSFFFDVSTLNLFSFLANLGIILLFFYIGLETNFKAFTKNLRESVFISLFNTILPLTLGFLVAKFVLDFNTISSLLVGIIFSVSAQSVSVVLLDELGLLKTRIGSMIISSGAVDDIIELFIVTLLLSVFNVAISEVSFMQLVFDVFLFLIVIAILRVWVLRYALRMFDEEKSSTTRFMGALIIVLLIASFAELLGIGSLIGAMIAGIIIRQTIFKDVSIPNWEEHDIAHSIHILAFGFLIPLFFVWIGLNASLKLAFEHIDLILIFISVATFATVFGSALAVALSGGKWKEGFIIGWGLNPKGDIELVIAALALKGALITQSVFTAVVFMSLVTTIISPIVFKNLVASYHRKYPKRQKS